MSQPAASPDLSGQFLAFVQQSARAMRAGDAPPKTLAAWEKRRAELRGLLIRSWGGFPRNACPLNPRVLGTLTRDGYRVEKVVLQTRPGVWMTSNLYLPDGEGPRPAVLCVHGHWRGAKQDPTVQARCIGLARLGFVVLCVDAFGAGERGIDKALGEYHGEMTAATLWPTGVALAGLQVYENMRAVDYLRTRREVDPQRIGVTGASGGGNQTMYAGAVDERLKCVAPVCSVGTYQAYLGAACCMCEVTPGALTYAEESEVLALVAPRALMLISATRDAFQFSVGEAEKSLAAARQVFALYDMSDRAKHAIFESRHDYSRPMREAMYGWMTLHLKGEGSGEPIDEPEIETENPEILRCYPGDSRPVEFITVPKFAAARAQRILDRRPIPDHLEQWRTDAMTMRQALPRVLGEMPRKTPLNVQVDARNDEGEIDFRVSPEPGITILARRLPAAGERRGLALLLDLEAARSAGESTLAAALRGAGWDVATADLRATGTASQANDQIRRAPDHNTAEWAMWIGRPLLGQWTWDVVRLLDALDEGAGGLPETIAVVGAGPASLVALCCAVIDSRIDRAATIGGLASYVSDASYENQRLGIMAPGMLPEVGDVAHLAALAAPRRLAIGGGVAGGGQALSRVGLKANYAYTHAAFELENAAAELRIVESATPEAMAQALS